MTAHDHDHQLCSRLVSSSEYEMLRVDTGQVWWLGNMKLEQQIIFHFTAKISYNFHLKRITENTRVGRMLVILDSDYRDCLLLVHIAMY